MSASPWQQAFQHLEPGQQAAVQAWLNTQTFIAQELGLEPRRWFKYVEWAFKHPFDFGFAAEAGSMPQLGGDALVAGDDVARAANLVGVARKTVLPGAGGIGNLLGMVASGARDRAKTGK